jgi:integrase
VRRLLARSSTSRRSAGISHCCWTCRTPGAWLGCPGGIGAISVGGEIQRGEPKTENGRRVVALDPMVVAALKGWRAQQAAERLAAGVPVADVSKLAGHADIRTTVNTYGHIQVDNRLAAALLLAARLDG